MTTLTRKLEVITEDDSSTLLKVAFATQDRVHVDQHFGSASAFMVYGVNMETRILLNACEFSPYESNEEDKLSIKLQMLEGCIAVYCRACGASAAKQLTEMGVQPIKVQEGAVIEDLIAALQQELRAGPSSWLARAVTRHGLDPKRFDEMEMNGWEE